MGRKRLPTEVLQPLVKFAIESGEDGITRKTAIKKGVITNSRWALIKNRAVSEGLLVRDGWKKSARYYAPEFAPKVYDEETGEALPLEEDFELDTLETIMEETKHEEKTRLWLDPSGRINAQDDLGMEPTAWDYPKWEVHESHNGAAESDSPPQDEDNLQKQLSEIHAVEEVIKGDKLLKTAEQPIANPISTVNAETLDEVEEEDWDFDFA